MFDIFGNLFLFIGETRVTTPTAIETQLPWKRNEDDAEGLQQNEFPAWSNNKEYLAYNSPSATFLGNFRVLILCLCFTHENALESSSMFQTHFFSLKQMIYRRHFKLIEFRLNNIEG